MDHLPRLEGPSLVRGPPGRGSSRGTQVVPCLEYDPSRRFFRGVSKELVRAAASLTSSSCSQSCTRSRRCLARDCSSPERAPRAERGLEAQRLGSASSLYDTGRGSLSVRRGTKSIVAPESCPEERSAGTRSAHGRWLRSLCTELPPSMRCAHSQRGRMEDSVGMSHLECPRGGQVSLALFECAVSASSRAGIHAARLSSDDGIPSSRAGR
jgi:hypothetical protein